MGCAVDLDPARGFSLQLQLFRRIGQIDALFRARRAGDRAPDSAEVEFDNVVILHGPVGAIHPQVLRLAVKLGQTGAVAAPRIIEIVDGSFVDRAVHHRRPVFRRHVRNSGPVCDAQVAIPRPEEFDKRVDDTDGAQFLCDHQRLVFRLYVIFRCTGHFQPDDPWHVDRRRLAKENCFGFKAANTPAHDAERVDHWRMAVGSKAAVRNEQVGVILGGQDRLSEILQIDLMADAASRRDDAKTRKARFAGLEKRKPLAIDLEFAIHVLLKRKFVGPVIDRHGMVNHQIDRQAHVDGKRIAPFFLEEIAHRHDVDQRRDPEHVMQE